MYMRIRRLGNNDVAETNSSFFESPADRNYTFEDYHHLVNDVMTLNMATIARSQLEEEDLAQELSIALIRALDAYSPDKHKSLEEHLRFTLSSILWYLCNVTSAHGITETPGRQPVPVLSYEQITEKSLEDLEAKNALCHINQFIHKLCGSRRYTKLRLHNPEKPYRLQVA